LRSWRWIAIGIFVFSMTLNFLDRQLLSASAPLINRDLGLSNTQYGELISAFSLTYALLAPFVGNLIDRIGLLRGVLGSVLVWSVASAFTGRSHTLGQLVLSRMGLGLGEAGALPAASKVSALYLPASEWGIANAVGSVAVTVGSIAAPLLVAFLAPNYGWRFPFILSGLLGVLWIVVWWFTSLRIQPGHVTRVPQSRAIVILSERRLWRLMIAYALVMALYMFWLNWTTVYLVHERHLSVSIANRYFAWIPPICATFGGFVGGGLVFRWIEHGVGALRARLRVCWIAAPLLLVTSFIPWIPSTVIAIVFIGAGLLCCMSIIVSLNVIPVDLFGPQNAAFSTSLLASSYALMQSFLSPLIGQVIDHVGFSFVCVTLSLFPLIGISVLRSLTNSMVAPALAAKGESA
jgi:ACS family hexuronate transporter-like MFS transporter